MSDLEGAFIPQGSPLGASKNEYTGFQIFVLMVFQKFSREFWSSLRGKQQRDRLSAQNSLENFERTFRTKDCKAEYKNLRNCLCKTKYDEEELIVMHTGKRKDRGTHVLRSSFLSIKFVVTNY